MPVFGHFPWVSRGLIHEVQDHEGRENDESDPHVGLFLGEMPSVKTLNHHYGHT